jgi:hypothetical protein
MDLSDEKEKLSAVAVAQKHIRSALESNRSFTLPKLPKELEKSAQNAFDAARKSFDSEVKAQVSRWRNRVASNVTNAGLQLSAGESIAIPSLSGVHAAQFFESGLNAVADTQENLKTRIEMWNFVSALNTRNAAWDVDFKDAQSWRDSKLTSVNEKLSAEISMLEAKRVQGIILTLKEKETLEFLFGVLNP